MESRRYSSSLVVQHELDLDDMIAHDVENALESSLESQPQVARTLASAGPTPPGVAHGHVERIWLKRAHRGPMDAVDNALLIAGQGVDRSVGRSRRRQITLFERERWEEFMSALDGHVDPSARRANLLVSGVTLPHTRGRILCIGDARIEVGGELTPCERMDEALPGLQGAMRANWGGGVFGAVLIGGRIHVGDAIEWERGTPAR